MLRFQWVRCQLDALAECSAQGEIEATLKELPKDLNGTYERILGKIVKKGAISATRAEKILTWLVGSMRHLRLTELEEALMIEPGNKKLKKSLRVTDRDIILTTCGSLVEVFKGWDGAEIVRLSHYTVQVDMNHSQLSKYD